MFFLISMFIYYTLLFTDMCLALDFNKKNQINFIINQVYGDTNFIGELTKSSIKNIETLKRKKVDFIVKSKEKRKAIKTLAQMRNQTKNLLLKTNDNNLKYIYHQFLNHKLLGKYFITIKTMEHTFVLDIVTYFLEFNTLPEIEKISKIEETYLNIINFIPNDNYCKEYSKQINNIRADYTNSIDIITPEIIKTYIRQFCLTKIRTFLLNLSPEEQEKFIEILITVQTFKSFI